MALDVIKQLQPKSGALIFGRNCIITWAALHLSLQANHQNKVNATKLFENTYYWMYNDRADYTN